MAQDKLNDALRQVRRLRHLRLADVGTPPLSSAAVSRFEKHGAQLAGEQLPQLIERLGLSSHDLSALRFGMQEAASLRVTTAVAHALAGEQFAEAMAAIDDYEHRAAATEATTPLPLAPILAQALRVRVAHRAHQPVTTGMLAPVVAHLTTSTPWYDLEYEMFAYTGSAMTEPQVTACLTVAEQEVAASELYAPSFLFCARNLLEAQLMHLRWSAVPRLIDDLAALDLREPQGFDPMTLAFTRALAVATGQWAVQRRQSLTPRLQQLLECQQAFDSPTRVTLYHRLIEACRAAFRESGSIES
ncbi:hypothetical protein [Lacticaseibacillus daqingensis]|uniref:hypothetical protein n=1 Tax=Lacticaseibacillus daqingensis TaxID=2486014 RepID=UPI000F77A141|nr:hypothetical protein [Lacticaseibacillus daqingensis]